MISWIDFQIRGDGRGRLVPIEESRDVPFSIKRIYYIHGTPAGVSRGFHAHRALEQVAFCVAGSCRMVLDNGVRREEYDLNDPGRGLYIGHMIWREMHDFSPDCVLVVLASEYYDEEDYIRNYDEFTALVEEGES